MSANFRYDWRFVEHYLDFSVPNERTAFLMVTKKYIYE